jgi:hypothetical protein
LFDESNQSVSPTRTREAPDLIEAATVAEASLSVLGLDSPI